MAPGNLTSGQEHNLLYFIGGVRAYHLFNGNSQSLTPAGPPTLSLLMVPTTDASAHGSGSLEGGSHLHVHLPPELDLPLSATTKVYRQPPTSYLIRRSDMGPGSGAFTLIEFPAAGMQEDIDTFEAIMADCTAFEPMAPPDTAEGDDPPPYTTAEECAGPSDSPATGGQLVLTDVEDGSVWELADGFQVVEDGRLQHGSEDGVVITFPSGGSHEVKVAPASGEGSDMPSSEHLHPAYQKSRLVSGAAAASCLMVTCSEKVSETVQDKADSFTKRARNPMTFKPATSARIHRMHDMTDRAKDLSSKAVDKIERAAQNLGATLARRKDADGIGADGKPLDGFKSGTLKRSLRAIDTVAGGVEHARKKLVASTTNAADTMVADKCGPEVGEMVDGVKNVALVYLDVTGVSHWSILKGVAAGMVVGKTTKGQNIIVGGGVSSPDKGDVSEDADSWASSSHSTVSEGKKPANG